MIDRRKAIRTAILGIGVATTPQVLFDNLTSDYSFESEINNATTNKTEFWKLVKSQFNFEGKLKYFNHGSLGCSPQSVIDATEEYRRSLESFPSKYMWGGWKDQVDMVRSQAAKLLNANNNEIALIHNTTEGMNVVAASLELKPGDEVIVGNHEHRTATAPWLYHQERKGIKIIRPELPLIPLEPKEILEVYANAITPKTKVISMVHLTNTNGMILPVKEICALARSKNIITVIDGAQSLGNISCDVKDIGCDYFTASGHKWLFSPKGVGLFYAKANKQKLLKPFIANYNYEKNDISRIEDYNTRNIPDLLGLGAAMKFHNMIGLKNRIERTLFLRERFLGGIKSDKSFKIKTPLHPQLSHQIITVEKVGKDVKNVKNVLSESHHIDVRGMTTHELNGVRISISIYHDESDIDELVQALRSA